MAASRTQQDGMRPTLAAARMGGVVLRLAWSYAVTLGPVVAVVLIVSGVLLGEPLLRYSGALLLGLSAAVLLNDVMRGLCGGGFPLSVLSRLRGYPPRRRAMIVPLAALLAVSLGVTIWASVGLVLYLLRT